MLEIGSFINSLCRTELEYFRHAEKLLKKLSNCGAAVLFNRTCLKEELLPDFTKFGISRLGNTRSIISLRINRQR